MNEIDVAPLDAITLDQLRTFLAVADTGTFSAAGRRLGRVQSAVSHAIAALEAQLGFALFDRSTRLPTLTERGRAVLVAARSVSLQVEALHATARALQAGAEATVALVVDAMFPTSRLVAVAARFQARWPEVRFRVRVEALGAVIEQLRRARTGIAVAADVAEQTGLVVVSVGTVEMVPVAAASHPLAALAGAPIPTNELAKHVQIVLSGRGEEETAPDRGVLSPRTWRVADMEARQALIAGGLGWGNLPVHRVEAELASGALVRLTPAVWAGRVTGVGLVAAWLPDQPPGPAGRWLVDALRGVTPEG